MQIDGFRFDIMGHLLVSILLKMRARLDALTLDKDGVDGRWEAQLAGDVCQTMLAQCISQLGTGRTWASLQPRHASPSPPPRRSIYIYGEAWDFGEMVDNARGINCGQLNLGGGSAAAMAGEPVHAWVDSNLRR